MCQRKNIWLLYSSCLLFLFSCNLFENYDDCEPAPYDCLEYEPDEGILTLRITLDNLNSAVPIVVYRGDIEDEQVELVDTLDISGVDYSVPNGDYSATAEYKLLKNNQIITVFVVDGGEVDASSEEYCEGYCYEPGELTLDLNLDPDLFD